MTCGEMHWKYFICLLSIGWYTSHMVYREHPKITPTNQLPSTTRVVFVYHVLLLHVLSCHIKRFVDSIYREFLYMVFAEEI